MNAPNNITYDEWNDIETWLDQNDVSGEALLWTEKLTQISNLNRKIEYVKRVREEIEDSIRQSKIKSFHPGIHAGSDGTGSYWNWNQESNLPGRFSSDEKGSEIKSILNVKTKSRAWFTAAAILVILVGIYWMMGIGNPSERVFAENFKPDVGLPLRMENASAYAFYEGMLDYKLEDYEAAIEKWEVLLRPKPQNDTLNYFLGVSHLALGDAAKALEYLGNQERYRQGIFKDDAAWYAALAKIKEGNFEEARLFLQKHPSTRNTKLLNELNKL
ncbi:MAG: hypothetical protein RBS23_01365 [Mariniphaga sp.]|jgi:tetratricopeptide (TPR) repeat protein|nr:hypothetical protein [Mariniphaga sp.]MDY0282622.1 hypothetical protein [Salinivirgaceae bacterium]